MKAARQRQEVTGDFLSIDEMDKAALELRQHHFKEDEMGLQKTVHELHSSIADTYTQEHTHKQKIPWHIRDTLKDIFQENLLMGGMVMLVGLGIFMASVLAVANLNRISFSQDLPLFLLLIGFGLIVSGIGLVFWMIRDTRQQFKRQRPEKILRFWVKANSRQRVREAMEILRQHGARNIHTEEIS